MLCNEQVTETEHRRRFAEKSKMLFFATLNAIQTLFARKWRVKASLAKNDPSPLLKRKKMQNKFDFIKVKMNESTARQFVIV